MSENQPKRDFSEDTVEAIGLKKSGSSELAWEGDKDGINRN